jgi:DNA (cytosine-5)-methyltransferase 1
MISSFKTVDIFAGPGGLAEGFSSLRDASGQRVFDISLSVEKEESAFATLRLRAFTASSPNSRTAILIISPSGFRGNS